MNMIIYICERDEKSFVTQKGVQKIFFENKKGIDPSAHSVYFTLRLRASIIKNDKCVLIFLFFLI